MTHSLLRPARLAAIALLGQAWLGLPSTALADNPIIQNVYTADPAPVVYGDTVYLCTSHDEDVTVGGFFTMNDWRVYSSKDMVNWTDHGSPLSYKTFSWATGKAWAPHCISRNGKFYMFVPVSDAIGVAVSDSPTGPFVDAIGKPLVSNYQYIDPTVFTDTDGQAYLYFGNPKLWYVKLNTNMTSYTGQVQEVPMTTASFGARTGDAARPTLYEEGPWFYKRGDLYYMMFAMGPLPERIGYSTSSGPTGPWTYKGVIMNSQSGHAFTNHAGVIDFKGHSYFFYHTQELSGGGGYKRSVAAEEFTYKADGSLPTITKTAAGITQSVAPLNPYVRVEGETIAWAPGIEIEDCSEGGRDVTQIENNDSIKVKSVDFGTGATSFAARVAAAGSGGTLEVRLGSASGTLLGTCTVPGTGGAQKWQTVTCSIGAVTGVQDLVLVAKGGSGSLFALNYWQFTPKDPIAAGGAGGTSSTGGVSSGGTSSTRTSSGGTGPTTATNSGGAVAAGGKTSSGGNGQGGVAVGLGGSVSGTGGRSTASSGGAAQVTSGGTSGAVLAGGSSAHPATTQAATAGGAVSNAVGGALSASGGMSGSVTSGTQATGEASPSGEDGSGCTCSLPARKTGSYPWAVGLLGAVATCLRLRRARRR